MSIPDLVWTPELVERFWSLFATTRLVELSFSRLAGAKLLELIATDIPPHARCLDFGAGDGHFARQLIAHGIHVAVFEPSEQRRENLLRSDVARSAYFLGAIEPGSDATFDVVFLLDVIEHILPDDLDPVLRSIRDFVKPEGKLVVSTPNSEDLALGEAICPTCAHKFHRWQHVRSYTPESLRAQLAAHGFVRVRDHRVDFSGDGKALDRRERIRARVIDLARHASVERAAHAAERLLTRAFASRNHYDRAPAEDVWHTNQPHLVYVGRRR